MFDEKTGQKFFSPNRENNKTNIIIQSSEVDQCRKSLCDYMYSYSKKFTQKKENITKLMNDDYDKRVKMRHTNNTTEMIYNRRKLEVFRRIFNTIDRDGEGTISSYNNNFKHLPPALNYILEPIIMKIKVDNCRFNEEQFIDTCENLFENLLYDQKLILMNYYKPIIKRNKSAGDNFTFKPSLNRRQQRNIIRLDKKSLNNSTSSSSMNHLRRHTKYINSNYILSSEK